MTESVHDFDFDTAFRFAGIGFGIRPDTCRVILDDETFTARFGPWTVATPIGNVAHAVVTGPYSPVTVMGPPHLAIADRSLMFATNRKLGTCVMFREPVTGLLPFGLSLHPSLTVTVADPAALAELVNAVGKQPECEPSPTSAAIVDLRDDLEAQSVTALRRRASDDGVPGVQKLSKGELVDILGGDGSIVAR